MASPPTSTDTTHYTPLPSPRKDDDPSPKPEFHHHDLSQKPIFLLQQKYNFPLRILAFIVLEAGFTLLVSLATTHPIRLTPPSNISLAAAAGALTFISLVWQAVAIFCVKDILLSVFSSEWAIRFQKSGRLIPGETDIVSRLTAGLIIQIQHFISPKATLRYRLAFISSLLLMAVNSLGPSAITVNHIFLTYPQTIPVANVTFIGDLPVPVHASTMYSGRATTIAKMEMFEKTTFGFKTDGNTLIPWPSQDLLSANGTIRYRSDVATYNFTCVWKQPTDVRTFSNPAMADWRVDGLVYSFLSNTMIEFSDPTIVPIDPAGYGIFPGDTSGQLTGFLFFGSDFTLPLPEGIDPDPILSLHQYPLAQIPSNNTGLPLVATFLLCDPQPLSFPAEVELSQGVLRATPEPGSPAVGNLRLKDAMWILRESLSQVTGPPTVDDNLNQQVGAITGSLFLTNSSFMHGGLAPPTEPLPLDKINENMNKIMASASKAYLSGRMDGTADVTAPSFKFISIVATAEKEGKALVGSEEFLIGLVSTLGLLVLLLGMLLMVLGRNELREFDLENILKTLHTE